MYFIVVPLPVYVIAIEGFLCSVAMQVLQNFVRKWDFTIKLICNCPKSRPQIVCSPVKSSLEANYFPEMKETSEINFVAICGILHLVTQSNVTKLGSWLLNQCKYMYSSFCAQNQILFTIFVRIPKFINLKAPIQKMSAQNLFFPVLDIYHRLTWSDQILRPSLGWPISSAQWSENWTWSVGSWMGKENNTGRCWRLGRYETNKQTKNGTIVVEAMVVRSKGFRSESLRIIVLCP